MPYKDPEQRKAYHREYYKRWYERNLEKKRAQNREWHENNREHSRQLGRQYYVANRERVLERTRAWDLANPEKVRAMGRLWTRKRRALVNGFEHSPALELWCEVLRRDPCGFCGEPSSAVDHIEPLSKGGAHEAPNFAGICRRCNASKSNKPLLGWMLCR